MKRLSERAAGLSIPLFRRSRFISELGPGDTVITPASARHRWRRRQRCRRRFGRFAPSHTTFFHLRATPVFTIARRTHRRSIFPLFLLCPAMRRVNGPFSLSSPLSLFPLFLSSCLFPRENLLAFVFSRPLFLLLSLCPIASVVLATSLSLVASLFRSSIFLSLSLSVFLHCRCGSRTVLRELESS